MAQTTRRSMDDIHALMPSTAETCGVPYTIHYARRSQGKVAAHQTDDLKGALFNDTDGDINPAECHHGDATKGRGSRVVILSAMAGGCVSPGMGMPGSHMH